MAEDLRLPGYPCYSSATTCTTRGCMGAPCLDNAHQPGKPRTVSHVWCDLAQAVVPVADVVGAPWSVLRSRCILAGLRGDFNAHYTDWGSRRCSSRGRSLRDAISRAALVILNSGRPTYVHQGVYSVIDLSLKTEQCSYSWVTTRDTWALDHFPIVITSVHRRKPKTRTFHIIEWSLFRKRSKAADCCDILDAIAECAQEATVQCSAPRTPLSRISAYSISVPPGAARSAEKFGQERTEYRRVDARCRRQARRRRSQSWVSLFFSIKDLSRGPIAWRLLNSLTSKRTSRQPVLAVAISLGIGEELLADRFAPPVPQSAAILPVGQPPAQLPTCLHSVHTPWTSSQVPTLCQEPLALDELLAALGRGRRRSAPRADGVTPQMLRNLATSKQRRLLECFNEIWQSGQVPEAWRKAIVAPILKAIKPVAHARGSLADQQTGFWRRRCTADSIADKVSILEDVESGWDLVMLLLIDVQGFFSSLSHAVDHQGLDLLGICDNLREFLSLFLHNRTLRSSIYANDIALWVRGPPQHIRKARVALQRALDNAAASLCSIGLTISARKTALAAASQSSSPPLSCPAALGGRPGSMEQGSHLPGALTIA
ncbi:uncharacterized protein [Dermacentor andersoni]|uniref:uncharacterized protein n=1 Tax=Dermacentor andersoni TaxID=34620 RepID=UPI003B3A096D